MMLGSMELPRWPATIAIGGAAAMVGVLAVVQPVIALGLVIGLAFIAVVLGNLTAGLALFAFVAFIELPGPGGAPVAKAAGLALLGSWLAWMATRRDTRADFVSSYPIVSYLILLFIAWTAATALWAEDPGEVLAATMRFAPNLLLLPIAVTAIRDRRGAIAVCSLFVIGVLTSMLLGALLGPGAGGAAGIDEGDAPITDGERLNGAGVNPNELAMTLVGGAALAAGLTAIRTIPAIARIVVASAGVLCVVGVLLTASRTGLVGLAGAVILGTIFAGRGRRVPLLIVGMLAALSVVGYFVTVAPEASQRIMRSGEDGGSGRDDIWAVGWRMVKANPLQGVGAGNYTNTSVDYLLQPGYITQDTFILDRPKVAHNIYLGVLAELGIVGLVLFLTIVGFALRCALRAARIFDARGDPTFEIVSRMVLVAAGAMLLAGMFVSQQFNKPLWIMLALGPALLAMAHHGNPPAPVPASPRRAHLSVGARM